MRNFDKLLFFLLLFWNKTKGLQPQLCSLQRTGREGAKHSVRGHHPAASLLQALIMPVFRQHFFFWKAFWEGKFLWFVLANCTKKDVSNEKRSQGWHFSISFISRQLQLQSPHLLGVSAHPTNSIPLLIWARSLAASTSNHRDSPASQQVARLTLHPHHLPLHKWVNGWESLFGTFSGHCCATRLVCSPLYIGRGVSVGGTLNFCLIWGFFFWASAHRPQVRKSGAGEWQVGFLLSPASTTCYSLVGISTKYMSPQLEEKKWVCVALDCSL